MSGNICIISRQVTVNVFDQIPYVPSGFVIITVHDPCEAAGIVNVASSVDDDCGYVSVLVIFVYPDLCNTTLASGWKFVAIIVRRWFAVKRPPVATDDGLTSEILIIFCDDVEVVAVAVTLVEAWIAK